MGEEVLPTRDHYIPKALYPGMRSILLNSHSLLHNGQTERAFSQRCNKRKKNWKKTKGKETWHCEIPLLYVLIDLTTHTSTHTYIISHFVMIKDEAHGKKGTETDSIRG